MLGDHDLMATEGTEQEIKVDLAYTHRAYQLSEDLVADIALVKLKLVFPTRTFFNINNIRIKYDCYYDLCNVPYIIDIQLNTPPQYSQPVY